MEILQEKCRLCWGRRGDG